jgi:CDP-diacylglycerol--glycerol-3-phosphate 3-phosphatidyltransferase
MDRLLSSELIYGSAFLQWLPGVALACLCEAWLTIRLFKRYPASQKSICQAPRFSAADFVTFGRGFVVACVAGFLFLPEPSGILAWIPGTLYLLAVIADYWDGYLARLHNNASEFGAALDRNFDGFITIIGTLQGILYDHLPVWYFSVGLSFFVFSAAIWIRKKAGRVVFELPASNYRRVVGGSNALLIGIALTPALPVHLLYLLSTIFAFLVIASFFRDWLSITGACVAHSDGNSAEPPPHARFAHSELTGREASQTEDHTIRRG